MRTDVALWWQQATAQPGRGVALWRLPGAGHRAHGVASPAGRQLLPLEPPAVPPPLPHNPPGFAFFPFQFSAEAPAWFIPAAEEAAFDLTTPPELLPTLPTDCPHLPPLPYAADEAAFRQLVTDAVAFLRGGGAHKLVGSRAAVRPLPPGFDALAAFARLCALYPREFVSLVRVPGAGLWLGATPELLAAVEGDSFRTVALAGTQLQRPGITPETAGWGTKEQEEQAYVTAAICAGLDQAGVVQVHQTGPRTVAAGSLLHLRTDFEAVLRTATGAPIAASVLTEKLHPTPAVGGTPRLAALEFLARHEGYDRRYYSGFLGPVNLPATGSSRLFVNLRCAELRPTEGAAVLYAGAGLTAASDPAREWQETELKLQTVGRGIFI